MSAPECYRGNNPSAIPAPDRDAVEAAFAGVTGPGPEQAPQVQLVVDAIRGAEVALGRATLAGYVELGDWLHRLWDRTPTGTWLRLFKDSEHPITRPLRLSRQQAEAFTRIARDPIVSNPKNWDKLPSSWRIADTIIRTAKEMNQSAQDLIDSGRVHRHVTRAEVEAFAAPGRKKRRPRPITKPVTIEDVEDVHKLYLDAGGDVRALITHLRQRADVLEDELALAREDRAA
jgi:hypothetical protein